ncbi:MAG: hypothetical protein ABL958_21365, partial [Bdellovibrionia bacterium]
MMESNKSTKIKALVFSIFVHSTIILGIAMASFEVVRQTIVEMDFTAPSAPAPATQEIEIVDSKPAELPKALPQKEDVAVKAAPVPVAKAPAKPKAKAAIILPAKKTAPKTEEAVEVVKESPVVVPPETETEEPEQLASSDEAVKEELDPAPVPVPEEKIETEDPQE